MFFPPLLLFAWLGGKIEPVAPFKALAGLAGIVPLPLDGCTEETQKLGHVLADQEGSEGSFALSSHVLYSVNT